MPFNASCRNRLAFLLLGILLAGKPSFSSSAPTSDDFADKSIEELMNVDVTTVSRKEQKLSKVPAAVYVVTQEAIQRSGATDIPDVLRIVPGVQVAQVEADRWAISIRGFNSIYSNKLLVLVDGRTVYTPSFSGVYWDQLDIPLDTIEQIEVVRGSGGATWGANAVDGVINIITFNSKDTQGGKVEAGSGNYETENFQARYGGKLGHWGTFRAFGDYRTLDGFKSNSYSGRPDGWDTEHGGFRIDARLSTKDQLAVDGDGYTTDGGQLLGYAGNRGYGTVPLPLSNEGFHILGRWTHTHSDNSESTLQVYQNEYHRDDVGMLETSNTVDVDFENRTKVGQHNDIVWGAGYRFTGDSARMTLGQQQALALEGLWVTLHPEVKQYSLFSGFFQDELSLTKSLALTAGGKVEHNAFSGLELEPTARLAWTPTDKVTVWAAASRSIRQPSRIETAVQVEFPVLPLSPGVLLQTSVQPNPNIAAETANTYETGFRLMPNSRLSFDLSTFYSSYGDLHTNRLINPGFSYAGEVLTLNLPTTYVATGWAHNYGSELAVTGNVTGRWKLSGSYSWMHDSGNLGLGNGALEILSPLLPPAAAAQLAANLMSGVGSSAITGSTPRNSFSVQSYFDATRKWNFDQSLFYVGTLAGPGVPSYFRLDLHTSYKLPHGLQASLVGQNLLAPRHLEFSEPSQLVPTEPERSIFGKLTWSF